VAFRSRVQHAFERSLNTVVSHFDIMPPGWQTDDLGEEWIEDSDEINVHGMLPG
jgi:hypothetical protein